MNLRDAMGVMQSVTETTTTKTESSSSHTGGVMVGGTVGGTYLYKYETKRQRADAYTAL